jgi:hypothetical protein
MRKIHLKLITILSLLLASSMAFAKAQALNQADNINIIQINNNSNYCLQDSIYSNDWLRDIEISYDNNNNTTTINPPDVGPNTRIDRPVNILNPDYKLTVLYFNFTKENSDGTRTIYHCKPINEFYSGGGFNLIINYNDANSSNIRVLLQYQNQTAQEAQQMFCNAPSK